MHVYTNGYPCKWIIKKAKRSMRVNQLDIIKKVDAHRTPA